MDLYRFNLRRILGPFLLLLILTGCNSINARNDVDEPLVIEAVETMSDNAESEPKRAPKFNEYPVKPFKNDALYQLLVAEVAGYRGEYELALEK